MSGIPNHSLHSLITSTDTVRKIFIKTLFIVNSNDFSCVLLIGIKCRRVLKSPIYADEIKILSITKEEATDSYVMFIPFYRFVYKELFVFLWRLSLFLCIISILMSFFYYHLINLFFPSFLSVPRRYVDTTMWCNVRILLIKKLAFKFTIFKYRPMNICDKFSLKYIYILYTK